MGSLTSTLRSATFALSVYVMRVYNM